MNLRRLEEISQNASRPDRGLMIDGWSVGLSPGLAKRSRCINPFYPSTRSFEENLAAAKRAYAAANLPCLFRITPFVNDAALDARLEAMGYVSFDPALVMVLPLAALQLTHLRPAPATVLHQSDFALAARWAAQNRGDVEAQITGLASRWQLSAATVSPDFMVTANGERVAQSVSIMEDDHVGIFDVRTEPSHRNLGLATALIAHQLSVAKTSGAVTAYLQVRPDNPARRIYERMGFQASYEYWYRALPADAL